MGFHLGQTYDLQFHQNGPILPSKSTIFIAIFSFGQFRCVHSVYTVCTMSKLAVIGQNTKFTVLAKIGQNP
jgi:hypothetical protein